MIISAFFKAYTKFLGLQSHVTITWRRTLRPTYDSDSNEQKFQHL